MINANKDKLSSFFIGSLTYEVPFFQRAYVWELENWELFWEHCLAVLERYEQGKDDEHFIGTIITKQRSAERMGESVHDLIDGQQRLTTVALFLKAIRNRANGVMPRLKAIIDGHLSYEDAYGTSYLRITHSRYDRHYFAKIMKDQALDRTESEHLIPKAYKFFFDKLAGFPDERLDKLRQIVLEKVPVISMMLSPTDDEQEIFDTINSLGVRLTTGELLKNYLFMDSELQPLYEELWETPFESSEELAAFWDEEKTAGRIIRTNIEVLLYCYLIIQTGHEVRIEKLFSEYKTWLKDKGLEGKRAFMVELKQYASYYVEFPSGQDFNQITFNEHEKRFFHLLENLSITTAYPLVLYLYKTVADKAILAAMLRILEAYLVRRNVCRLTTKNYNQLFMQIINSLARIRDSKGSLESADLRGVLAAFADDSTRVPSNAEFKAAFATETLSNRNSREILFCLALHHSGNGLNDMQRLSLSDFSVEHMMPRSWEANWTTRQMDADEKALRNWKLRTLGNLTLVTKKLNSAMQNSAWNQKRDFLRPNSALRMTTEYLGLAAWDETTIDSRAGDLATTALAIWPF